MLQTITKSMKCSKMLNSCCHQFSVLFLERKDVIAPYDKLIIDITGEDLKNEISK